MVQGVQLIATARRGRSEIPLYADYLYRLDHEAGIDISKDASVEGLVQHIALVPPGEPVRVDGDERVVFLFDVSQEPRVESVQVEALVGNDYQVDAAQLEVNPRGRTHYARFMSTFYRSVLCARGNVQDLSNLARRRFDIGEDTGVFTYSSDLSFQWPGLAIHAEYARSARYGRYPAQQDGTPLFRTTGPRFAERGSAYTINATRWLEWGRIGGEYFAINPGFPHRPAHLSGMGKGSGVHPPAVDDQSDGLLGPGGG